MLKSISWYQLVHALVLVFGIYYLLLLLIYYRKELLAFFQGKPKAVPAVVDVEDNSEPFPKPDDIQNIILAGMLAVDLRILIKRLSEDHVEKTDILRCIGRKLEKFPYLRQTKYGAALSFLVIDECEKYKVVLNPWEVAKCWEPSK